MIDTITLTLDNMFVILEPEKFNPHAGPLITDSLQLGGRGHITCVQNITKEDRLRGIYRPYLTLTRRYKAGRSVLMLKIQLSLPKLLHGNNFDELSDPDYPEIVEKLRWQLQAMGVRLWDMPNTLDNAMVSGIHYGKNIILTDGSMSKWYIDRAQEGNYTQRLDTNQTDYRNEGTSWKIHTNKYEVALYDKLADIKQYFATKSDKRCIERDNFCQMGLFDVIPKRSPFEVLRLEVRFNNRAHLKKVLGELGYPQTATFRETYSQELAQKVLLRYVDMLEKSRPALLDYQAKSDEDLFAELRIQNPKLSVMKLYSLYGLKKLMDQVGLRTLRQITGSSKRAGWYKLMSDARHVQVSSQSKPFASIRDQITTYKPVRLVDYREQIVGGNPAQT